ncbi:5-formyltetrahydrofolate cyclo-ligase [Grosmannia clavigera kw1407]|uniref:5-formyltetrahydrofolate cyclo-ligase n=1 Tax=Grosmannia clavigera (strain kw1407 / UAMH 11150) TaxID=655863 RepID=F0XGN1_GROCL|nr:5-formyltetrahydrofolate cyclo-ligase [Grosmannia clavigera kw1407]EFX02823.1 5-formyltetrahydrofolate cyclo-ligase [Grosmannia clavigera kw1407]
MRHATQTVSTRDSVPHRRSTGEKALTTISMSLVQGSAEHKAAIRAKVWATLRAVARPDSRFHYDFSRFIADFAGADVACDRLLALDCFQHSRTVFIAPDNCLGHLRERALQAGLCVLVTTYGICRGFWLLDPATIAPALFRYAATLDGMEHVGRPVSLQDLVDLQPAIGPIGLMVTGTGAINTRGVRFGKGHGFFDLEWAMLFARGLVRPHTVVAAVVHDCQLLDDDLRPEPFDTVCDLVITPTRVLHVGPVQKPTCGILWDRLQPNMLADIPPLQELQALEAQVVSA